MFQYMCIAYIFKILVLRMRRAGRIPHEYHAWSVRCWHACKNGKIAISAFALWQRNHTNNVHIYSADFLLFLTLDKGKSFEPKLRDRWEKIRSPFAGEWLAAPYLNVNVLQSRTSQEVGPPFFSGCRQAHRANEQCYSYAGRQWTGPTSTGIFRPPLLVKYNASDRH